MLVCAGQYIVIFVDHTCIEYKIISNYYRPGIAEFSNNLKGSASGLFCPFVALIWPMLRCLQQYGAVDLKNKILDSFSVQPWEC
jgi:hypothetical protein